MHFIPALLTAFNSFGATNPARLNPHSWMLRRTSAFPAVQPHGKIVDSSGLSIGVFIGACHTRRTEFCPEKNNVRDGLKILVPLGRFRRYKQPCLA